MINNNRDPRVAVESVRWGPSATRRALKQEILQWLRRALPES